jgi:hypothetical protein
MTEAAHVDMTKLESELVRGPTPVPEPERRKVFGSRETERQVSIGMRPPLGSIAEALKRLIWDDNEKLGQMIATHFSEKSSMASAVQKAADDLLNESEPK